MAIRGEEMADLINAADSLNAGRGKINAIIKAADAAVTTADNAATTANEAKTTADSVQTQLDTIILDSGTSDAEIVQSRVDKDGNPYQTLKSRLDSEKSIIDQSLVSLGSQLAEAATKAEVTVERERIDSFTTLAAGSTTGDAELIDARVGADGITYPNAGGALRGQITKLSDSKASQFTYDTTKMTADKGLNTSGAFVATSFLSTDESYYSLSGVKKIYYNLRSFVGSLMLAFYDANKTFISGIVGDNAFHTDYADVPITAKYFRYSCVTSGLPTSFVQFVSIYDVTLKSAMEAKATNIIYKKLTDFVFTENKGIALNGAQNSTSFLGMTNDLIEIESNSSIFYNLRTYTGNLMIAFYDINKAFISGVEGTGSFINSTVSAPANAKYVKLSTVFSNLSSSSVFFVTNHSKQLQDSVDKTQKEKLYDGFSSLFGKYICIGDSLTQGALQGGGAVTGISYPDYLARLTGATVTNAGHGGASGTTWYQWEFANFNYANYDCAIIGLGTNEGLPDTVTGANTTDHTGYYCKIIEEMRVQNPDIKIVLIGTTTVATNVVIQKIADRYGLSFLDIYYTSDYFKMKYDADALQTDMTYPLGAIDTIHMGSIGYLMRAKCIYMMLNKDIYTNYGRYEYLS